MGILLASCVGISKTMYCDRQNILDLTPVDVCVKAMIISAWKRAHEPNNQLPVINCASANQVRVTINQLLDIGINGVVEEFPMGKKTLLPTSGGVTLCKTYNLIRLFFFQLIPAMIVDNLLHLKGKRGRYATTTTKFRKRDYFF